MMAASLWIGAIGGFALMTSNAHKQQDHDQARVLLEAVHAFAPVGISLVGIVAITGLINANLIFKNADWVSVLATPYGILLAAKICLVVIMLACAKTNAAIGRNNDTPNEDVISALQKSLIIEFALAFCVIGAASVLGLLSPLA